MTSADLEIRLDLTAAEELNASAINQVTATAKPASDKGLVITTNDDENTKAPSVPDPNTLLEGVTPDYWVRYIWRRVPATTELTIKIKFYTWDERVVSDATYLKWVEIFDFTTIEAAIAAVEDDVETANATANAANANAQSAVANVEMLTIEGGLLANRVAAVESMNTQQNTRLDEAEQSIENIAVEQQAVVPIARGGSGGNTEAIARTNFGLQFASRAFAYLYDSKAANTNGGTFTAGDWRDRDLNQQNNIGIASSRVSLAANVITLQPGSYIIEAECPAFGVNNHQCRLIKASDSTVIAGGTSEFANLTDGTQSKSKLIAFLTITEATTYKIQHRGQDTINDWGFGRPCNFGSNEIYTTVKISIMD